MEVERELRKSLEMKVKWKDTIEKATGQKVIYVMLLDVEQS